MLQSGHMDFVLWGILGLVAFLVLISIKQVNQYERGVRFQFGKFIGMMDPGWRLVWPIIQSWQRIDIRVKAVDVPDQEAITKDTEEGTYCCRKTVA